MNRPGDGTRPATGLQSSSRTTQPSHPARARGCAHPHRPLKCNLHAKVRNKGPKSTPYCVLWHVTRFWHGQGPKAAQPSPRMLSCDARFDKQPPRSRAQPHGQGLRWLLLHLTGAHRSLLAIGRVQNALAQTNVLGRDLHELVVGDVLERLLERKGARRRELNGNICR